MSNIGTEKRMIGIYIAEVVISDNSKDVLEKDIIETNANKTPNKYDPPSPIIIFAG